MHLLDIIHLIEKETPSPTKETFNHSHAANTKAI